jgi:hypothetical protein
VRLLLQGKEMHELRARLTSMEFGPRKQIKSAFASPRVRSTAPSHEAMTQSMVYWGCSAWSSALSPRHSLPSHCSSRFFFCELSLSPRHSLQLGSNARRDVRDVRRAHLHFVCGHICIESFSHSDCANGCRNVSALE